MKHKSSLKITAALLAVMLSAGCAATASPVAPLQAVSSVSTVVLPELLPYVSDRTRPGKAGEVNMPPTYPAEAKRAGLQGRVEVRVFVDVHGNATKAEILRSTQHPILDNAALEDVLSWRYKPGTRNGIPEGMWTNFPIAYSLH